MFAKVRLSLANKRPENADPLLCVFGLSRRSIHVTRREAHSPATRSVIIVCASGLRGWAEDDALFALDLTVILPLHH